MAEEADQDADKTEEPSERKKQKAREEGVIAYSKEVGTTLGFMAVVLAFWLAGESLFGQFRDSVAYSLSHLEGWRYGEVPFGEYILPAMTPLFAFLGAILAASFFAPLFGHVLQKGVEPQFEAAQPQWDAFDPVQGTKKLFSMESFLNFLKNAIKTLGFMAIFYLTVEPYLDKIVHIGSAPFEDALALTGSVFARFLTYALVFMAALAGGDYFVSWRRIHNKLRMTRHEMKEELKDSEGNPQIKHKVRQIQQERAKRKIQKEVPKATVVVVNPTHFAVALKYEKGKVPVPKVVAKGTDYIAKKIREVAQAHGVPLVENPPLARALYREVKVGREIPYKFYKTVAKIIAAILRLEEEKKLMRKKNYPTYALPGRGNA